jgi:alkyl hydroperoxide reductase subunit AhpF
MDPLLDDGTRGQIRQIFAKLVHPLQLLYFSQAQGEDADGLQLLNELAELTDKIKVSAYTVADNPDFARQYHVERTPSFVLAGLDGQKSIDYGIRFAGFPGGHEFSSLIGTLIMLSQRESGLNPETKTALKNLVRPVNLKVFSTPT